MNLQFHHIGVACKNLDREAERYSLLGYRIESEDFEDPVQGVRGRFLVGGGPRIELLMGLVEPNVLTPWLNAGMKMYHLAYLSFSFDVDLKATLEQRGKIVAGPVSAVAFNGRQIAFVMMPNLMLVELIEG
jgi:methylmalonyl-CoA/ethylmalonyl-CoA epimerase